MRLGNVFMTFLTFSFSKLLKIKFVSVKKNEQKKSFPQLKKIISNIIEIHHSNFTNYSKSLNELPTTLGEFNVLCI